MRLGMMLNLKKKTFCENMDYLCFFLSTNYKVSVDEHSYAKILQPLVAC